MALEIDATYENGVLKLDRPLPLDEILGSRPDIIYPDWGWITTLHFGDGAECCPAFTRTPKFRVDQLQLTALSAR